MKALTSLVVLITTLIMINGLKAEQITVLHINDHHSHLKPDKRMSLMLDGKSTRVPVSYTHLTLPTILRV